LEIQKARRFAIEAKYLWPRLDRVSLRPDAAKVFSDALERRLTIVCAPAGYGKTTTTAAALDARGHRSVWYKLDVLDRDPLVFIAAMTRAVRRLHAGFGEDLLRELESGPVLDVPPEALAARFCSECDRVVNDEEYIVLDDYHETMDAPAMDDMLGYLLDNCPGTLRFVVLSRYEPAFRLEKLRLAGELARIPRDLLLFDAGQVAEVLAQQSGQRHDSEHVLHLLALTEGWPASVVLAGMTLAWLDVASLEVALGDPRLRGDVFSYLAEQVFQRQSAEVQHFLLRTCCLEHVHGELAERLVGESTAHRHLHFLARNHIFTFESGRQGSYRYHNLLRDFLRQRFVQDRGESAFNALQRETADALEACGDRPAAVELLLSANEVELALAAVARGGESLLERLPYDQLVHWMSSSFARAEGHNTWALIMAGVVATRDSRFREALVHLHEAEASLIESDDDNSIYQVLSILEWAEFWAGDSSASMSTSRRALAYARTDGQRLHTLLSLMSAAVDMRNWDAATAAASRVDDYLASAQPEEASRAQALKAYAAYYQGKMHSARQLITLCPRDGRTAAQRAAALNIEGMIETALAEYDAAAQHLAEAAESAVDLGHSLTLRMIEDSQACLSAAQGDRRALETLEALGAKGFETQEGWLQAFALCHHGTVLRRMGDAAASLNPTQMAAELASSQSDPYLVLNIRANLAASRGLLGQANAATLDRVAHTARRGGLRFVELKAVLFKGVLAHLEGDNEEARELLEECLPSQLELGHINFLAQELCPRPELASLLLRRHRSNGLGPALIDALSRHWRFAELSPTLRELCQSQVGTWIDLVDSRRARNAREPHEEPACPAGVVTPSVLDELTPRERQVLAQMELSNEEIARNLFIALPTVKSHVTHILRKMGHTKRLGAVLEYRRLSGPSGRPVDGPGSHLHPPA
jgi:LuxR family maltose regulon positive regulatory protein